jgi:hypothetical protein
MADHSQVKQPPTQAHLQGTQSRHTIANLAKKPALFQRFLGDTLLRWTHIFNSSCQDEGRTVSS